MDLIGKSSELTLYTVRFRPGCLETRCWGNELFDCFVLNRLPEDDSGQIEAVAKEVAKSSDGMGPRDGRMRLACYMMRWTE